MKKNKARIIDPLSYSTVHETFNSALLYMCSRIFESLSLRCSYSSYCNVTALAKRNDPSFEFKSENYKPIKVVESDDPISNILRYFLGGFIGFFHYLFTPKSIYQIYPNSNPVLLLPLVLFNRVLKKSVAIFFHGELCLFERSPRPYKPSFYYKYTYELIFKYLFVGDTTTLFVLGDSILKNLQPYLSEKNKKRFFSIEHPYYFNNIKKETTEKTTGKLRIGTVGVLTYTKGLGALLELSEKIDPNKVDLVVVGRVMKHVEYDSYPNIRFLARNRGFIPREEYEKEIAELDYVLFLYPKDSYRLIASGAVFDAIDMKKPIIGIMNNNFKSILKCPIGYLSDDLSGVLETINDMVDNRERYVKEYPQLLDNMEVLKQNHICDNIVKDLEQKL